MKKLSKKTISLLERVKQQILEEPKRLDMLDFGYMSDTLKHPCGTTACIAGWSILLDDPKVWGKMKENKEKSAEGYSDLYQICDPAGSGRLVLGIDEDRAYKLFYTASAWPNPFNINRYCWPSEFSKAYKKAKTAKTRAKVTAERIDHFIATNGAE